MSAEKQALYAAYYNRSVSSSSPRHADLAAAQNISNQTTTPAVTLEPLNLTAIMLETAAVIDIVHEPSQHSVCRPDTCIGCLRSLPNDSMTIIITFDCRLKTIRHFSLYYTHLVGPKSNVSGITPASPNQFEPNLVDMRRPANRRADKTQPCLAPESGLTITDQARFHLTQEYFSVVKGEIRDCRLR